MTDHQLSQHAQPPHHISHQTHTQPAEFSPVREPRRGSYTAYPTIREDESTCKSTPPLHIQPQTTQISQITLRAIITLSPQPLSPVREPRRGSFFYNPGLSRLGEAAKPGGKLPPFPRPRRGRSSTPMTKPSAQSARTAAPPCQPPNPPQPAELSPVREPRRGSYAAYPAMREDESTSKSTSPLHHSTTPHSATDYTDFSDYPASDYHSTTSATQLSQRTPEESPPQLDDRSISSVSTHSRPTISATKLS